MFDCIDTFYNPKRRHSGLGYLSAAEFERSYRSDQLIALGVDVGQDFLVGRLDARPGPPHKLVAPVRKPAPRPPAGWLAYHR